MIRFFFRESGKIQGVVNNMKRKSNMDKQGRGKKLSVAAKVFFDSYIRFVIIARGGSVFCKILSG